MFQLEHTVLATAPEIPPAKKLTMKSVDILFKMAMTSVSMRCFAQKKVSTTGNDWWRQCVIPRRRSLSNRTPNDFDETAVESAFQDSATVSLQQIQCLYGLPCCIHSDHRNSNNVVTNRNVVSGAERRERRESQIEALLCPEQETRVQIYYRVQELSHLLKNLERSSSVKSLWMYPTTKRSDLAYSSLLRIVNDCGANCVPPLAKDQRPLIARSRETGKQPKIRGVQQRVTCSRPRRTYDRLTDVLIQSGCVSLS